MKDASLGNVFREINFGGMRLKNRIMCPPHAAFMNLFAGVEEAKQHVAYWAARARGGVAWIDGITGMLDNVILPPGFEPTGIGAVTAGVFRLPYFRERASWLAEAVHTEGAVLTSQIVMQAGMPHGASAIPSAPIGHPIPHQMDRDEIRRLVGEYRFAASEIKAAGLDGLELHANHDDLLQVFLSSRTNHRSDEFGGNIENRLRFIHQILEEIRAEVGKDLAVGVRLNLDEGRTPEVALQEAIDIASLLEATGLVDYFSVVAGSPWGNPSYIQSHAYQSAQWAESCGRLTAAVSLPVVYAGRVTSLAIAEEILERHWADVVGMARAHIADPEIVRKTLEGRPDEIRPCIGCNDCINRPIVEGLRFSCTVNPQVGREVEGPVAAAKQPKRILVVGGGPAGMELAAIAGERGHKVSLWEAYGALGGQMRIAAKAPTYEIFLSYIDYQSRRLARAGVDVSLSKTASADDIIAGGFDSVAIATGATARRPGIPGDHSPFVFEIREVLAGASSLGKRVLVIAQDEHMPPLAVADYLATRGHLVTVVYPGQALASLLSRYSLGGIFGRLSQSSVNFRVLEQAVKIDPGCLTVRNIYSRLENEITDFDSIVLACGSTACNALYHELKDRQPELHLLGDAYAPRRVTFATQQAYALALQL